MKEALNQENSGKPTTGNPSLETGKYVEVPMLTDEDIATTVQGLDEKGDLKPGKRWYKLF